MVWLGLVVFELACEPQWPWFEWCMLQLGFLRPDLFVGTYPYQAWAVVDFASRSHNGVTTNDSTEVWLAACCAALCG